jgi:hypothetical protein
MMFAPPTGGFMFRQLAPALLIPLLVGSACATRATDEGVEVHTGGVGAQMLRGASDAVTDIGTFAFELTTRVEPPEHSFGVSASGAADARDGRVSMDLDLGSLLGQLADEPLRFIVDGSTIYLRMPMLDQLTGTAGWLSASPDDLGQGTGLLDLGPGGYDPSALLDALRGVAEDVREVGHEEVRGVPTAKYAATVSLAAAVQKTPAGRRERLRTQLEQIAADARMPVEVWVDRDGLPRRVTMSFGEAVTTTIELFDYGRPLVLDLPSADQTTPIGKVLGQLGAAFGTAGS